MYNGVGVTSTRGLGTSGYVSRNLASTFKQTNLPTKSPASSELENLKRHVTAQSSVNRDLLRREVFIPLARHEKELLKQELPEEEVLLSVASKKRELLDEFHINHPPPTKQNDVRDRSPDVREAPEWGEVSPDTFEESERDPKRSSSYSREEEGPNRYSRQRDRLYRLQSKFQRSPQSSPPRERSPYRFVETTSPRDRRRYPSSPPIVPDHSYSPPSSRSYKAVPSPERSRYSHLRYSPRRSPSPKRRRSVGDYPSPPRYESKSYRSIGERSPPPRSYSPLYRRSASPQRRSVYSPDVNYSPDPRRRSESPPMSRRRRSPRRSHYSPTRARSRSPRSPPRRSYSPLYQR
ncbi:hypothetical protein P9112_010326 [Eukaryota sp. TZLM1-RC]